MANPLSGGQSDHFDAFAASKSLSGAAKSFQPAYIIRASDLGAAGPIRNPSGGNLQPTEAIPGMHEATNNKFTEDTPISRHLILTKVKGKVTVTLLFSIFSNNIFGSLHSIDTHDLGNDHVYVSFFDVRDAIRANHVVNVEFPSWVVHYIKPRSLSTLKDGTKDARSISNHEGTALVVIENGHKVTKDDIYQVFAMFTRQFGSIKAVATPPGFFGGSNESVVKFVVEFYDSRHAHQMIDVVRGSGIGECRVTAMPWLPDVADATPPQTTRARRSIRALSNNTSPIRSSRPYNYDRARPNSADYRNDAEADHWHNTVHLQVVANGQDVRTTIMIRNIPRRVTKADLLQVLNSIVFGKFDFMYLRIDFAKGTNIGYAFVNFPDPMHIIELAQIANVRWKDILSQAGISIDVPDQFNRYATISYATVQGCDCLVQKFRNSNIMVEPYEYRPMLLVVGTNSLAGTEIPFPEPDNMMKFQRSCDNAEHIGLFSPRLGQCLRHEQRNRRSQFERGTTAAEREAHFEGLHDPARNLFAVEYFMHNQPPRQLPHFYGY